RHLHPRHRWADRRKLCTEAACGSAARSRRMHEEHEEIDTMANSASAPRAESQTTAPSRPAPAPPGPGRGLAPARSEEEPATTQLVTEQGRTVITDTVVSKIAGTATRQVDGVHGLGGGTARAVEALRGRIPGARINHSQGVAVEVGERQTAIDI